MALIQIYPIITDLVSTVINSCVNKNMKQRLKVTVFKQHPHHYLNMTHCMWKVPKMQRSTAWGVGSIKTQQPKQKLYYPVKDSFSFLHHLS